MRKQGFLMLVALVAMCPGVGWAQGGQGRGPGQGGGQPQTGPFYPIQQIGAFESGCGSCHDNAASTRGKAPTRAQIVAMDPEKLLAALNSPVPGHEAVNKDARFASEERKRALIELITGKAWNGGKQREAASMPNRCANPLNLEGALNRPSWNGWIPDRTTGNRFVPEKVGKLTAAQVPNLKLKWAFAFPDGASAAWSQPSVVGGALFMTSDNFHVYALDAKTGCVHWSYKARTAVRGAVNVGELKGVPNARFAAYFGDMFGDVYAINAKTGQELWVTRADPHPAAKITSAVMLDPSGERLYVPVASWEEQTGVPLQYECCSFQGSVVGINVKGGQKAWQTYSFQERPQPLSKKNTLGRQLYGPAGGGVWSTMVLDMKRRAVYAGTGNCITTQHFGVEDFDRFTAYACDAVLAVEMDSGKRLWQTQMLAGDRDEGGCGRGEDRRQNCPAYIQGPGDDVNQTILETLPNGRRLIIAVQESGRITALDPDNRGAVVWVAQSGDQLAPNGSAWGGASDGEFFYRPLQYREGIGAIAALRLTNGERVWYTELPKECEEPGSRCSSGSRSAATVIPGAVFIGHNDGTLRAFSTKDGKVIWQFRTQQAEYQTVNGVKGFGGAIAASSPTVVDGMLYIGSGYAALGGAAGNVVLAFGVD